MNIWYSPGDREFCSDFCPSCDICHSPIMDLAIFVREILIRDPSIYTFCPNCFHKRVNNLFSQDEVKLDPKKRQYANTIYRDSKVIVIRNILPKNCIPVLENDLWFKSYAVNDGSHISLKNKGSWSGCMKYGMGENQREIDGAIRDKIQSNPSKYASIEGAQIGADVHKQLGELDAPLLSQTKIDQDEKPLLEKKEEDS